MTKLVIFGECMLELSTQSTEHLNRSFAGDTYNTAVYLKRCEPKISVSYLTAIGNDFISDELFDDIDKKGIKTDLVLRSEQDTLGLYMIKNDPNGERSFLYWRSQSAAKQTINLLGDTVIEADWFYFSGISIAILDEAQRKALFAKLQQLKQIGCKIIFDPNYRARLWENPETARHWIDIAYQCADLVFPGGDDHKVLFDHDSSEDIYAYLKDKDCAEIVIKNGPTDIKIITGLEECIVPVKPSQNVVDTTSAGDAFNAGYLAYRLTGKSCSESARFGAKVANVVIGQKGAIIPEDVFDQQMALL
ncbi:sugar kinase [Glaciecola sp. 1036]|uniref:sugar kinase n=1 Tax=Alteromonadaceae TaxID=72275 RepID=UPI003CFC98B0